MKSFASDETVFGWFAWCSFRHMALLSAGSSFPANRNNDGVSFETGQRCDWRDVDTFSEEGRDRLGVEHGVCVDPRHLLNPER